MSAEIVAPALDQDSFNCPRCGAFSHQQWNPLMIHIGRAWEFDDSGSNDYGRWKAARCQKCGNFSVWREDRMMYPHVGTVAPAHPDMPLSARELYDEAREVVGVSRRAGAALARAALERLLRELDPEAGKVDLAVRLDRMQARVSGPLWELLTVVRHVGNKSLHVEDQPDDVMVLVLDPEESEIVDLIFAAINDLVEEVVARPARTRQIFDKLPEGVLNRSAKAIS